MILLTFWTGIKLAKYFVINLAGYNYTCSANLLAEVFLWFQIEISSMLGNMFRRTWKEGGFSIKAFPRDTLDFAELFGSIPTSPSEMDIYKELHVLFSDSSRIKKSGRVGDGEKS